MAAWQRVVFAHDCAEDEDTGEPVCPHCEADYADCDCPGPHMEDEYDYEWRGKTLWARPKAQN